MLGIYQLAAIIAGIEYWLELPWIISIFIAFFITYIPLIGTAMGVLGAVTAWGWSWPVSYTHLRAHETEVDLVCRLLFEKQTHHPT